MSGTPIPGERVEHLGEAAARFRGPGAAASLERYTVGVAQCEPQVARAPVTGDECGPGAHGRSSDAMRRDDAPFADEKRVGHELKGPPVHFRFSGRTQRSKAFVESRVFA